MPQQAVDLESIARTEAQRILVLREHIGKKVNVVFMEKEQYGTNWSQESREGILKKIGMYKTSGVRVEMGSCSIPFWGGNETYILSISTEGKVVYHRPPIDTDMNEQVGEALLKYTDD